MTDCVVRANVSNTGKFLVDITQGYLSANDPSKLLEYITETNAKVSRLENLVNTLINGSNGSSGTSSFTLEYDENGNVKSIKSN